MESYKTRFSFKFSCFVMFVVFGAFASTDCFAIAIPQPGVNSATLRMQRRRAKLYPYTIKAVDLYSTEENGQRGALPIRITISSKKPVQKDQVFYIGFSPNADFRRGDPDVAEYQTKAVLAKGERHLELDFYWGRNYGAGGTLVVSVDGLYTRDSRLGCLEVFNISRTGRGNLRVNRSLVNDRIGFFRDKQFPKSETRLNSIVDSRRGWYYSDHRTRVVNYSGGTTNLPNLDSLSSARTGRSNGDDSVPLQTVPKFKMNASGAMKSLTFGPLEHISTNWKSLTALDAMVIPAKDFRILAKEYPLRIAAVRKWVTAGGTLILSECGADWKSLSLIAPSINSGSQSKINVRNWQWSYFPREKKSDPNEIAKTRNEFETIKFQENAERYPYDQQLQDEVQDSTGAFTRKLHRLAAGLSKDKELKSFQIGQTAPIDNQGRAVSVMFRDYGKGRMIAVSKKESQWSPLDWSITLSAMKGKKTDHYIGQKFLNRDVPEGFAIESVGEPPVVVFVVMIFAFSVLVGPVFYTVLNRYRRVQWLVFVIPAFSVFVSVSLLLFTLAKDGVNLQSKRLSVAYIDQSSGVSLSHNVQTLFQGVSPGSYRFDAEAMVTFSSGQSSGERLVLQGDKMLASRGSIAARSKHNAISLLPGESSRRVDVQKGKDGSFQITNKLGQKVEQFVTNLEGNLYYAQQIEDGSTVLLKQMDSEFESKVFGIGKETRKNCFSEKVNVHSDRSYSRYYRNYRSYNNQDRLYSADSYYDGVERVSGWGMVGDVLSSLYRPNNANGRALLDELNAGEYVAFCNDSPFAVSFNNSTSYEYQLHVIHGKW